MLLTNNFEEYYKNNFKRLCLISFSYVGDTEEARDIVQEVFIKILQSKKEYRILNKKSYLNQAVRNASIDRLRKKSLKRESINSEILYMDQNLSSEEEMIVLEKRIYIFNQIDNLPVQCKKIFKLCVLEGLKYQETAEILGISINTVKTQIKKAYKILRNSLDQQILYFLLLKAPKRINE